MVVAKLLTSILTEADNTQAKQGSDRNSSIFGAQSCTMRTSRPHVQDATML